MLTFFKKIVVALIFFLFFNTHVKAQWVTIPDANFVYWLGNNYPGCMNGNLMDTTCNGIVNDTVVDLIFGYNISDLEGIQYFDNLKELTCSNNLLTSLPSLPSSLTFLSCYNNNLYSLPTLPLTLKYLRCDQNQLTVLPSLPSSLTQLDCTYNSLTSLPSLPSSLEYLSCFYNNIDSLPALPSTLKELSCNENNLYSLPALPTSLINFRCDNNQIDSLPSLPNSLVSLNCSGNNLSSIPILPGSLTFLNCGGNNLTSLPILPSSLQSLYCYYNNLTSLPALPDSLLSLDCDNDNLPSLPALPNSLAYLSCMNNSLTSLPDLPGSLTDLRCYSNILTTLPSLPNSLVLLWCYNNQISCIPFLPNSFPDNSYLILSPNPFTCLPNYVSAMDSATLTIPLCMDNDLINNPNACQSFKGVIGNTYSDNNADCSLGIADQFVPHIPIELFDSTNTLSNTFYTLSNGVYNYILDTAVYIVKVDTVNKPYLVNCLYPGIDSTITLTTASPLAKNVNFDIACKPGFDIGVKSVTRSGLVFPGFQHKLKVAAGDLSQWYNLHCATGVNGNVVISVNGPVTFDSIPPGALTPTTITGNTFSYTIADFGMINLNSFAMWFTTDTSAQAGDHICVYANVTPTIGDNDTTNNTYTFCYNVTNSYDPNDKQVYPTSVNPAYHGYFTYTINFQNVGTAAAQNIRVVDTLASNLDLSTFEIINYSHVNTSTLTGNVATFRFPNIQLADSASNPEGSKGFIQYRIKSITNLPFGTQIENKADIYFDFNTPITTNTAVSNFNSTVGLSPKLYPEFTRVIVYPNPGKGVFNLIFSDNTSPLKTIEVFSLVGEKVFSDINRVANSILDLSKQPTGVYILRVRCADNVYTLRIVKQ